MNIFDLFIAFKQSPAPFYSWNLQLEQLQHVCDAIPSPRSWTEKWFRDLEISLGGILCPLGTTEKKMHFQRNQMALQTWCWKSQIQTFKKPIKNISPQMSASKQST